MTQYDDGEGGRVRFEPRSVDKMRKNPYLYYVTRGGSAWGKGKSYIPESELPEWPEPPETIEEVERRKHIMARLKDEWKLRHKGHSAGGQMISDDEPA